MVAAAVILGAAAAVVPTAATSDGQRDQSQLANKGSWFLHQNQSPGGGDLGSGCWAYYLEPLHTGLMPPWVKEALLCLKLTVEFGSIVHRLLVL